MPKDRSTLRLRAPPPSAAHGNGRPQACLPCELSGCFPVPSDFSAGTVPQPVRSHRGAYVRPAGARGRKRFSTLSTGQGAALLRPARRIASLGRRRSVDSSSREGSCALHAALFAGRTMRIVGNHRGARTICLALVAGLLAFEAVLALAAGAVGIPGLFLVRFRTGAMTRRRRSVRQAKTAARAWSPSSPKSLVRRSQARPLDEWPSRARHAGRRAQP